MVRASGKRRKSCWNYSGNHVSEPVKSNLLCLSAIAHQLEGRTFHSNTPTGYLCVGVSTIVNAGKKKTQLLGPTSAPYACSLFALHIYLDIPHSRSPVIHVPAKAALFPRLVLLWNTLPGNNSQDLGLGIWQLGSLDTVEQGYSWL